MIDFTYNSIILTDYKSQRERTSLRSLSLGCPFVFANATSKFEPTQARKGLKGIAQAVTKSFAPTDARFEVQNPSTQTFPDEVREGFGKVISYSE